MTENFVFKTQNPFQNKTYKIVYFSQESTTVYVNSVFSGNWSFLIPISFKDLQSSFDFYCNKNQSLEDSFPFLNSDQIKLFHTDPSRSQFKNLYS